MKKWLTLSLALVIAAVSQAVTVAWTVPNSDYNINNWATKGNDGSLSFNVYFVYSSGQLTVADAYSAATGAGTSSPTTIIDVEYGYYMGDGDTTTANGTKLAVYSNDLLPAPDGNRVSGEGYYYMVVVNKDNAEEYAVAGTTTKVTIDKNTVTAGNGQGGIYANPVGREEPTAEDYFDMTGWLGGTWEDALVPEPTVLALLALGVAGVALRRKQNFTK
jgi:hypothetical protein